MSNKYDSGRMTAQQLKNSILQMAVQGKLVPQDPNDEPARVLLEKICAEKAKLVKEKKIKADKNESFIYRGADNTTYEKIGDTVTDISDKIPFDIPEGWEWVRLDTICEYIQRGKSPKYSEIRQYPVIAQKCNQWSGFNIEKAKFIEPSTISAYGQERLLQNEDLLWNSTGLGTLGRIAIYYRKLNPYELAVADSHVTMIRHIKKYIITEFLYDYFSNPTVQSVIEQQSDGTTKQKELATQTIKNYLIPLPPLSEQHRIVAKIEELLPYIDRYDEAEQKLTVLNAEFPEKLKKSILQMAVQGKLVPQNPTDESASVLLEKIWAEKETLIKQGKIKRDKNESVIYRHYNEYYEKQNGVETCISEQIPFEIPEGWEWVRWGDLSESIQYGYNAPAKAVGRIKMVRISDIQDNGVLWDSVPYCDITEENIEGYLLKKNDILFARTGGTVGKSYLVDKIPEEAVYAGYLIRTRYSANMCAKYLKFYMESQLYWLQLRDGTIATAQPNCNGKTLSRMLVPLPPLSEQHRIVAKIEEILPLCEKLS